jgi:hypothetical protein
MKWKWLYLASSIAGVMWCAVLVAMGVFGVITHTIQAWGQAVRWLAFIGVFAYPTWLNIEAYRRTKKL